MELLANLLFSLKHMWQQVSLNSNFMINKLILRMEFLKARQWMFVLLLINTSVAFSQTTYYSKASATDFNDVNTWGTANDGTGTSPSSISNADIFVIRNGAALSLSANASVRQLTISSGNLTISANTLAVAITAQNNTSITVSSGGTLNVSGGTLNVDGQFSITGTGILNQSGGSIVVDGNAGGVAASSVTGSIVNLESNALTFSGGVFQVVDPHQGTGSAFTYNTSSGIINASATHTFWFGSTTSTDAGGSSTGGFMLDTWSSSGRFHFGTLKHGGSTGTNRFMTFFYSTGILGDLIVETGGDVRTLSNSLYIKRNITVNAGGTLSATQTLYLADYTNSSLVASTIAQTISGAGTFRNSTATATANIFSLTVNNSSAAGVTLSIPLSVSRTLTLTTGIVHTTAANTLRLGTATGAGTLSGGSATANIDGPFLRTFAASRTASGTYTASTLFPVSKGGSYLPVWIDPTTNSGGPVILSGEAFTSNSGTPGSGIASVSSNRWEGQVVSGAANLNGAFLQLADGASLNAAKTILQATTAAGSYEAIPVLTTFTSGTLNTVRTSAIIPVASLTGFICYGEPLPCTTPGAPPTNFTSKYLTNNSFSGSFTASPSAPTGYLVVRYASGATPTNPVNGTSYAAAAALGTGRVVGSITGTTFNQTGLTAGTTYDYYIYSYNGGSGCAGPAYNTTPLMANVTTCAAAITTPTAASAVLVTTASFTARWNPSAGVTYLFDLSTSSTFTSFVTGYQELPLFDTFINLSGLNPASVYYYRVRTTNAGCYSNLSSVITVKTVCNPVTTLPYVEDFSSVAAGTIPVCMATENLNNDSYTWNTVAAPTTPAGFTNNVMRYDYSVSNDANDWFFTAALSLTAGTSYRLKFNYANGSTSYPEKLRVMYGNAQTNTAMTVQIYDNPNISDATLHTASVDFTPATSGNYYIGFKAYSISDQYELYVDSITLDLSPSCLAPVIDTILVTGPSTATARWKAPPTFVGAYDIYWSTSNIAPSGATSPNGYSAVDTFYAISGLPAKTKHYVWVRSNCGGNGTSAWSNADSFTTACNPLNILPYTENFNAVSAGTLPVCTYTENLNNDNNIWNTIAAPTTPAGFTGNVLRYNYNFTNAANDWFFTAPLSLTAGTPYRLTFNYANSHVGTVEKLRVRYGNAQTNTAMTIQIYDNPNIGDVTLHSASVDFVPATTGTYYIGFNVYSNSSQYNLYIDNINLDLSPSCIEVAIDTTLVTGTSTATVRWNTPAIAPAAGYDIFWSTSNTVPTGVTPPNGYSAVDTFYAISGLSAATKHYVWVRSNCGGSGTSIWSNVDSFTTACNPLNTLPYTENFNAVSAGTLPVCTYTENLNNDNGIWNTIAAPTTPAGFTGNVLRYNYNNNNAANDWFFTAPLSLTAGTSYRLTFDYGNNDADYVEKLRVMYGSLQTNTGMTVQIYDNPNIDDETKHTASVDFVPATTGTYYIGFKAYSNSYQYNLYVDNINLDLSPACAEPTIASTIVTGHATATARWNVPASAPAAGYDIYWSTSSTAPTGATSPNGYSAVDTFYAISGLSAATKHYVWVRSNCGGSGTSAWTNVDSFTTACNPVTTLPYTENFNAVSAGTLPACTYTENLNNDNSIWNTVAAPTTPAGFTGNVLRYDYNSNNAANDWFFTAPLTLTAGTSYRLTFDYGNNDAYYVEKLRVMYGSLQTNTSMTVQIFDNPNIDDETKHTALVDFVPATTGTYYIGFKAYSISDQYNLYVDNINLDLSPACADPTIAPTIVTGQSTATARWKAPASVPAAGYDIFWSTTYTPPTGVTSPNGYAPMDTFYAISGLSTATKHYIWVRSNCGGSGTSIWSNVDSFTTACNPVTTLPYTENFNAVSAGTLPACTYTENLNNDANVWNTVAAPTTPAGFTGNVLRYDYNSNNAANDWFFTAPLSLTAGTSYRLTFDYGNNDADYVEKLRVMYGSLQTNTGMTVQIYDNPNIDDETKHTASVDFVPATTGTYYIGFKAYSINNQYNLYIDNIDLDITPSCFSPTIAPTIVTGQSTAIARWNAPASAPSGGYDIYWSTSSTAPTGATSPNGYSAVDTFYNISGLSAGITHYVWVRSNCGGSGVSRWSIANTFYINLVVSALPYSQDFEGTATGWSSAAVSGNLNEWTLGTPAKINIIGSHSGTNAWVTNLTNDYSDNQNAALISPVFDLSSYATTPILRFYHQFEAEEDYDAGIVEISINNGVWVRLDSVAGTGSNWNTPNSYAWYNNSRTAGNISPRKFSGESATYPSAINGWIQSATYLTGAAGQSNVRIRFRFNSDRSGVGDGWAIDDIEILESPLAPSIPAFNISGTPANTTAALNWTNGNGSGRIVVARLATDVAVAPADFKLYAANAAFHGNGADSTGLGNYVVYNGTGTSVNVTGLTALTSYVFDVYEYNGKYMHVKFGNAGSGNITTTPVKLLSFDGVNVNGNVDLTWITASERNNAGFEIERSTDGKTFVKTGFVKGAGNSSVRLRYAFTDDRAFAKTATDKIYYRLKQLDNDKKFEYSNVIAVTENSKNVFSVTAFPVPFNSELKIGVASLLTANANIFICDLQGKVVFEQDIALNEGSNTITLNQLNNLDAGVYFVKVVQNNQTKVIRVMKAE
jgi:hypothetical protein